MFVRKLLLAAAFFGAVSFGQAVSSARADDLDVVRHTVAGESTETGDHGWGRFCDVKNYIPFYTCSGGNYYNGEGSRQLSISPEAKVTKTEHPGCDGGHEGGGDGGGDGGGGDPGNGGHHPGHGGGNPCGGNCGNGGGNGGGNGTGNEGHGHGPKSKNS